MIAPRLPLVCPWLLGSQTCCTAAAATTAEMQYCHTVLLLTLIYSSKTRGSVKLSFHSHCRAQNGSGAAGAAGRSPVWSIEQRIAWDGSSICLHHFLLTTAVADAAAAAAEHTLHSSHSFPLFTVHFILFIHSFIEFFSQPSTSSNNFWNFISRFLLLLEVSN